MKQLSKKDIEEIKGKTLDEIIGFDPFEITEKDYENKDAEIQKIEEYIKRLKQSGIYTDWQKSDLEYNQNLLKELKEFKDKM